VRALVHMSASTGLYTYTATRTKFTRHLSRQVRALVDQEQLYPGGRRPMRRTRFRLRNRALPLDVDEGYDSDETMRHKRMHHILATRVIRRLLRNRWAKKNRRRFLYFLCWVLKHMATPWAAKKLTKEQITIIAEYVGKYVVMDQTKAVHRTVFTPPYREWQTSYVRRQAQGGKYRLRK
jgi:hypothetical protein